MTDDAFAVIEFLLTARAYETHRDLDEGDLPPSFRGAVWAGDGVGRPVTTNEETAAEATGLDDPWDAISGLMFTDRDAFSGRLKLADEDLAYEWYANNASADDINAVPVLAYHYENQDEIEVAPGVDYELAREQNRPVQADPHWIQGLLTEMFDEDDEEMLDLVDVRAPAEIEVTLDDMVLTQEQEQEVAKVMKAIEHRDYLATVGLREIGKLLFVGPPGTGKTTTARGLAHELDLPFVEVKLSMITSQYLGETAKNVEKVFEVAKRLSPCILFIDEFDFVAKTRTSDEHAAIKRAVNTLLKSIDEISLVRDDVLLIGATNHPDELDAAVWRRFDEILSFPRPDEDMRRQIFEIVCQHVEVTEFEPLELAKLTEGLTGSDLRLVLREAVLEALLHDRMELTQTDLEDAIKSFEERDHLRNLDTLEDALESGDDGHSGSSDSGDGHSDSSDSGSGHDHDGHDHNDHDHAGDGHDHDTGTDKGDVDDTDHAPEATPE